MSQPSRVDVHHHFIPPKFAAVISVGDSKEWPRPNWDVAASQKIAQDRGIATAIFSLTSPGVDIVGPNLTKQMAIVKDANDTGAKVRDSNPSQFGFFATIPNPVEFPSEALAEITRALDDLHADGVCFMTSYSGKYLGDEVFQPIWTELNKRKAVAFIHPTSPPGDFVPVSKTLLPPVLDFTFETTKTASDLILSETTLKNPDVKIILSHAGGNLPWIWHRVAQLPTHMHMGDMQFETFLDQAKSFYFDTALTGWDDNIELLLKFAKEGHVLYGSDFPYAPDSCIEDMTKGLDGVLAKKDQELRDAVNWGNAMELFPRLKGSREKEQQSKL